jgi:hypothetical protein
VDSDLETGFFWILDSGSSGGRVGLYKDTGGFFKEIVELNFQWMVGGFQKDIRKSLSVGFLDSGFSFGNRILVFSRIWPSC